VVGRRPEGALGALYEVKGEEGDPIQRKLLMKKGEALLVFCCMELELFAF
jgi:hypothetical protein